MTVAVKEPAAAVEAGTDKQQEAAPASDTSAATRPQQHKHHDHDKHRQKDVPRQSKKRKRTITTVSLVIAVVAVVVALALPKAAQDERVRAAVSDSVQRLNITLVETFDVSVDGFLEQLARVHDRVSSIMPMDDLPRPGQLAAQAGLRAHHPIIIIPGFVTSGLELWEGEECAQSHFRQRLWGTLSMAQTLLSDRACWMRHMKLDPVTGADPPGIKLRAAKALEAVDYFVPGYWVFSKMIQSLSDIGYDNNNLIAVPYDWRLPMSLMEKRDGFFTRVKHEAELQFKLSHGVKPVLVSHSYGALVTVTFLHWVEQQEPGWVDKHLEGYVNLAGPLLGLPKALSPLLSGETRETVDMMAGLAVLVEQYLGKQSRASLFRTWGSVMAMLPVGGSKVWGNATFAPDDDDQIKAAGRSFGGIVAEVWSEDAKLRDAVGNNDSSIISGESLQLLKTTLSNWGNIIKNLGSSDAADGSDDGSDDENSKQEQKQKQQQEAKHGGGHQLKDGGGAGLEEEPGVEEAGLQVRFLDIGSALMALAQTAGEQFTTNLMRWAPAGQEVKDKLEKVLERQHQAAQVLSEQLMGSCETELGDYKGVCENSNSQASDIASSDAGSSSSNKNNNSDGENDGNGRGMTCSNDQQQQEECAGPQGEGSSSSEDQLEAPPGTITTAGDTAASGGGGGSSNGNEHSDSNGKTRSTGNGNGSKSSKSTFRQLIGQGSSAGDPSTGHVGDADEEEVQPADVLKTALPKAPDFKLYCFYGVGTATERGYHYLKTRRQGAGGTMHTEWSINNMADDRDSGLESGVQLSPDGDGTVPLLSLGALCAGGWKTNRLNPSGIPVVVREYPNQPVPVFKDTRGGPNASTHVELLGNEPMLMDLLHIAAGKGSSLSERYLTAIQDIASKIPWDEL